MSRRYWLPILAVVGLTLSAHAQEPNERQGGQRSAAQTQNAPQAKSQPAVPLALHNSVDGIRAAIEAAGNKAETPEEKRRADEDLEAQKQMAKSAQLAVIIGIAGTVITLAGVLLILATLIYTKRAAEAARAAVTEAKRAADAGAEAVAVTLQIGEAQVRAYLTAQESKYSVDATSFRCYPTFRNSGQSPARNVTVTGKLTVLDGHISKSYTLAKMFSSCNPIVAGSDGNGHLEFSAGDKIPAGILLKDEAFFAVIGDVQWDDVFGKKQTLGFTLMNGEKGELKAYSGGHYREGKLFASDDNDGSRAGWYEANKEWQASQKSGDRQQNWRRLPPRPFSDSGL